MPIENTPLTRAEFDRLVGDLVAAAAAYYDSDTLLMTDAEYDAGVEQVTSAVTADPTLDGPDVQALLGQVAAGQSAGGDVVHPTRMLSMEKAAAGDEGLADVEALVARVAAVDGGVVVEPKMDGLALRVAYTRGRLTLAATRGDGYTGENVTEQVTRGTGVTGLPTTLASPWTGEVRGEVFMTLDQFEAAQELRAERGGKPFVNPRNATAGALRKTGTEHWMPMTFAAYDLTCDDAPASHRDRMDQAARLGFTTAAGLLDDAGVGACLHTSADRVRSAVAAIETARPTLGFEIDGAVVKADADAARAALGEGSRTPRWALAYKYPAEEATAVVEDIEVTVGRTGRLGLRARITPTFVGGTTVTYATCHNAPWLVAQGIGIGSTVVLKRAGDVIPRITAPLDSGARACVAGVVASLAAHNQEAAGELDPVLVAERLATVREEFTGDAAAVLAEVIDFLSAGDDVDFVLAEEDLRRVLDVSAWTPPEACPQCGEPWNTESLLWRCETPSCGLVNAVNYFASRDGCMDVEGVGGVVAEALVAGGHVDSVAGLYELAVEGLAELPLGETAKGNPRRLGAANAAKIVANLEASKAQPLARVIASLGIRGTGRSLSRALAREFPTMSRLRAATVADLAEVEKIGPKKAQLIVEGLTRMGPVIDRLAAAGVNMGTEPSAAEAADRAALPLAGKSVVVSGSVPGYTRVTAQEAIEAAGGKASSSVSKTTSYLVTAETSTSKAKKAAQLGVPVIDPDQFDALLRGDL